MNTSTPISAPAEFCSGNARAWKERVSRTLSTGSHDAHVDLSHTRFIDSCGLGALLSVNKTMTDNGGRLHLLNPSTVVCQLIELTRLHRVFDIIHS